MSVSILSLGVLVPLWERWDALMSRHTCVTNPRHTNDMPRMALNKATAFQTFQNCATASWYQFTESFQGLSPDSIISSRLPLLMPEHGILLLSFPLSWIFGETDSFFIRLKPSGMSFVNCLSVSLTQNLFIIVIDLQNLFA